MKFHDKVTVLNQKTGSLILLANAFRDLLIKQLTIIHQSSEKKKYNGVTQKKNSS